MRLHKTDKDILEAYENWQSMITDHPVESLLRWLAVSAIDRAKYLLDQREREAKSKAANRKKRA